MRTPICHPTKRYGGHGLCLPCYNKDLKIRNPAYAQRCIDGSRKHNQEMSYESRKNKLLKQRYGITLEIYSQMCKQGCNLCGSQYKRLVVDHSHATKKVRGVLCDRCNTFCGYIEKAPAGLLEKLLIYVA